VVVVDPALVPLVVGLLGGAADQGGEVVGAVQRVGSVLVEQARGEVFGAVDLGRLGRQAPVPVGPGGGQGGVGDGGPVVGAGEGGGVGGGGEAVAAEPDGAPAVRVEVGAVAQGAVGLLAGGADAAVEFLRPSRVAEGAQVVGGAADLDDQRVGGEVGADGVRVGQGGTAPGDRLQGALRGGGELLGAVRAGVGEALPAGGERVVDLGALFHQLAEDVVGLREAGLQHL